jgi:hypothetical protein
MRIKVVKSLKQYLLEDECVYACHASLISCEETFNEQWFDVFLYYALVGLGNPKTAIRVFSLNVLCTIAEKNAESILELTERVHAICRDSHWEIKAQALEYAIIILQKFNHMSHVLGAKGDEIKTAATVKAEGNAKPATITGEKNTMKGNLQMAVDIINTCFNVDSPKSVQKIGLFKLQSLLPDYKMLYPLYVDVLSTTDDVIKDKILITDASEAAAEEIVYNFGNSSFNYVLKAVPGSFDVLFLANALIDLV